MKALILCAGLGMRLRPLTERWPKCGLPLLGQPLFRYNLALLKGAGVTEVGVNVHYLPEAMEEIARAECERAGMGLTVSREALLQGTGGGVRGFKDWIQSGSKLQVEPFIVLNGDVLFAVALKPLFERHLREGRVATMVLTPMPPNERFAAVEVDAQARVWRIGGQGRPGAPPGPLTPYHFASVQLLSPNIFDFMRAEGAEEIFTDVYARLWSSGAEVHAEVVEGAYWADLGTPRRYLNAAFDLLEGRVPLEHFPGASPFRGTHEIGPNVWAAPGALCQAMPTGPALLGPRSQLAPGSHVEGPVYLGEDVRIAAGGSVRRAVLFQGAQVFAEETVVDAIAWSGERLSVP